MEEKSTCMVCGTTMVKCNKEIKFDGSLKFDGSWVFDGSWNEGNNTICPKCHPELAETK